MRYQNLYLIQVAERCFFITLHYIVQFAEHLYASYITLWMPKQSFCTDEQYMLQGLAWMCGSCWLRNSLLWNLKVRYCCHSFLDIFQPNHNLHFFMVCKVQMVFILANILEYITFIVEGFRLFVVHHFHELDLLVISTVSWSNRGLSVS